MSTEPKDPPMSTEPLTPEQVAAIRDHVFGERLPTRQDVEPEPDPLAGNYVPREGSNQQTPKPDVFRQFTGRLLDWPDADHL